MGALSFAAPAALLGLLSLPLIWWLVRQNPPAPRRIAHPGVFFLRKLNEHDRTPARTPVWTLILRSLLVAALCLGLAGPVYDAAPKTVSARPLLVLIENTWPNANAWPRLKSRASTALDRAAAAERPAYVLIAAPEDGSAPAVVAISPTADDPARALAPMAWRADRSALATALDGAPEAFDTLWISDGLASDGGEALARALTARGEVSLISEPRTIALAAAAPVAGGLRVAAARAETSAAETVSLSAYAVDGRLIGAADLDFEAGAPVSETVLSLPPALRAETRAVRVDGLSTAGTTRLIDARARRPRVGLATLAPRGARELLQGYYYADRALEPHADLSRGDLAALARQPIDAIILDDRGALRTDDRDALQAFVSGGGVLIRFAGPRMARAARERALELIPAPLRGDERALDGALSWDEPQEVAAFPTSSPFAGLAPPRQASVKRQVLAAPGALVGDEGAEVWAALEDGTPLVTARREGRGYLVLFHMTLDPRWSDIPLSAALADMLRRAALAGAGAAEAGETASSGRLAALSVLSGDGRLGPAAAAPTVDFSMDGRVGPTRRPGLYGDPAAPAAINAVAEGDALVPLQTPPGVRRLDAALDRRFEAGPPLLALAGVLLILDALSAFMLSGIALRLPRRVAGALVLSLLAGLSASPDPAAAQEPLSPKAIEAALTTRLAYVRTGDGAIDETSRLGLLAISRELARRTSVTPGPPAPVDPNRDDLSVYAFLYWPISATAPPASDAAIAALERFTTTGGLVVFDTRDAADAAAGLQTPESRRLADIFRRLGAPPVIEPPADHVLFRSFFLLSDLTGRYASGPVLIAADADGAADGVTGFVIGGRDWASAWASDDYGRPLRPLEPGFPRQREYALRTGVNMAMVALSGNYKSDQLHIPELLRRLERRR